jgi:hypothetical protein
VSSGSVLAGVGHRRTRLYQAETNELALTRVRQPFSMALSPNGSVMIGVPEW